MAIVYDVCMTRACTVVYVLHYRMFRDLEKQGVFPARPLPISVTAQGSPSSEQSRTANEHELLLAQVLKLEQEQADEIEHIVNAYEASLQTSLKGTVMDPESKTHLSGGTQGAGQAVSPSQRPPPQADGASASASAFGGGADDATPTPTQATTADGSSPSTPSSQSSGGSGTTGMLGVQLAAMFRASLPPDLSGVSLDSALRSLADMINLCEISMRRIIAFAKRVPGFKRLEQTDQMTLLKGGSIELLVLRGVLSYDVDQGVFHGVLLSPDSFYSIIYSHFEFEPVTWSAIRLAFERTRTGTSQSYDEEYFCLFFFFFLLLSLLL